MYVQRGHTMPTLW